MRPNCKASAAANARVDQCLGGARHALDKDVTADEQELRQQELDRFVLADQDLAHFAADAFSDRADG